MYLIGQAHPNKRTAQVLLETLIAEKKRLVTSVEVFQEILHRYSAIHRREAISTAFDTLKTVVDEVFPIHEKEVMEAKKLLLMHTTLSARDALHVATMTHHKISTIFSFDTGFDQLSTFQRLPEPEGLSS